METLYNSHSIVPYCLQILHNLQWFLNISVNISSKDYILTNFFTINAVIFPGLRCTGKTQSEGASECLEWSYFWYGGRLKEISLAPHSIQQAANFVFWIIWTYWKMYMAATSILVSHFSVGNAYYFSNMIASFLKKSSWPQPHLAILLSLFSCLSCLHCTSFEPNVYQKQPHRFQIPLVKLFGMCYYCRLASSVITILFIPAEHQTECSFFSMLN